MAAILRMMIHPRSVCYKDFFFGSFQANLYLISESQHKYIRYQLELEKECVSGLTADATLISSTKPSAPESTSFSLPPLVHEKMVEIVKLCTQRLEDNLAVVTA